MVSEQLKGAVVGFMVLLCKGLLDDDKWDWDVEECDWRGYQEGLLDPTILKTTVSVFMNSLDGSMCENYCDARFRGFQYFRSQIESHYIPQPPFTAGELKEPDWYLWEG
jgi:hypothetical protein